MRNSALILFGLVLLVGGCPASEDEERRAATLAFLDAEPSPSSIAVIQPDAAGKLAEIEAQVSDTLRRDRLVRALVIDDTDESRAVLLDVLGREPGRIPVAFDTARRYQLVPRNLDLLYPRLDGPVRCEVFLDVCWPPAEDDAAEVGEVCRRLWTSEPPELQSRWLRRATHAGPSDDPLPYEGLRAGLHESLTGELDALIERIGGGEVVPAEPPEARDALRITGVRAARQAHTLGDTGRTRQIPFTGGLVVASSPPTQDRAGSAGQRVLRAVPADCVASWGAATGIGNTIVRYELSGDRAPPEVTGGADEPDATLVQCLKAALEVQYGAGEASWVSLTARTSMQLAAQPAASGWDDDGARTPLSTLELGAIADALRESGGDDRLAALATRGEEPPLLRDLGSTDLGFCMAYVAAGWADCALWIGRRAAGDDELEATLRAALHDPDPGLRALARTALAEVMDEEAIQAAEQPRAGDDDSADPVDGAEEGT